MAVRILAVAGPDRERTIEDARKVAGLSHPHVAESRVGLHEDEPFVATEWIEGSSLDAWLQDKHPLPEQIRAIAGIADAVTFCHGQGVLHRNLKASNVFVQPGGECKILDFGLGPEGGLSTATAAHLAPEVREGNASSEKADIWSAGALCYEILAGKKPDPVAPAPLRDVRRDVKQDLADAVMACLEKDPDWRPKDLTYILEMCRGLTPATPSKAPSPTTSAPASLPSFAGKKAAQANRIPAFVSVVAGVILAAAGAWYFLRPAPAPSSSGDTKATAPRPTANPETPAAPPSTEAAAPTPAPKVATPRPETSVATPPPAATPQPTPAPIAARATPEEARPTPAPATPPPLVEKPVETPTPAAVEPAIPLEPATLRTLTPPSVRRKATGILDLHGTSLRAEHRAIIFRGRDVAKGITVTRQRLVNPTLLQVVIQVDEAAETGAYSVELADAQGRNTNGLRFEVAK
jgi:serine/threonine protein kinase